MLNSKKAAIPTVVVALLLVVSITVYIYFQKDINLMTSQLKTQLQAKDLGHSLEIRKIDQNYIYVNNDFINNLLLNQIKVGSKECYFNNILISEGLNKIYIGSCSFGGNVLDVKEVTLVTNYGVISEYEALRSVVGNPLSVLFQTTTCDFASGYLRLYGLSALDNAHAEISNSSLYTYSACVKHYDFNLSLTSGITSQRIFSLTGKNNSAVWINKGSIYQSPLQWFDINLYSSDGTFSYAINSSDMSNLGYACIGKINQDDIYGSHIGSCSSLMNNTIWVKLQ